MRRSPRVVGLAAALVLAAFAGLGSAAEAAQIKKFRIDVALYGVGAISQHIRQTLPGKLAAALADRPVEGFPEGAKLIVRIDSIYLAQADEMSLFQRVDFGGRSSPDSIEGEARVQDANGKVLLRRHLIANFPTPGYGALRNTEFERVRVENLMEALAYWTVRGLN